MINRILDRFQNTRVAANVPNDVDYWSFLTTISKCEEIVQEVAKEYGNGWIPCSEKLPALHDNVLVCTLDGGRTIAYLRMNRNHILSERIFEDMYGTHINEVIAWQPLPAPYYLKGE